MDIKRCDELQKLFAEYLQEVEGCGGFYKEYEGVIELYFYYSHYEEKSYWYLLNEGNFGNCYFEGETPEEVIEKGIAMFNELLSNLKKKKDKNENES